MVNVRSIRRPSESYLYVTHPPRKSCLLQTVFVIPRVRPTAAGVGEYAGVAEVILKVVKEGSSAILEQFVVDMDCLYQAIEGLVAVARTLV